MSVKSMALALVILGAMSLASSVALSAPCQSVSCLPAVGGQWWTGPQHTPCNANCRNHISWDVGCRLCDTYNGTWVAAEQLYWPCTPDAAGGTCNFTTWTCECYQDGGEPPPPPHCQCFPSAGDPLPKCTDPPSPIYCQ